jgi:hypothetical protein
MTVKGNGASLLPTLPQGEGREEGRNCKRRMNNRAAHAGSGWTRRDAFDDD